MTATAVVRAVVSVMQTSPVAVVQAVMATMAAVETAAAVAAVRDHGTGCCQDEDRCQKREVFHRVHAG